MTVRCLLTMALVAFSAIGEPFLQRGSGLLFCSAIRGSNQAYVISYVISSIFKSNCTQLAAVDLQHVSLERHV